MLAGGRGDKVREVPFAERRRAQKEQAREMEAVNWLLRHLAADLDPQSATALAVRRRACWREIRQFAQWEGAFEVASLIEDAVASLGEETLDRKERKGEPA